MCWVYLVIAGFFETFWAITLKMSHGFSRPLPTVFTFIGMAFSFLLLAKALKGIPVGTGYAVWTGIGIVGTFFISMTFFHDSVTLGQGICVFLILAGIIGLRILSAN